MHHSPNLLMNCAIGPSLSCLLSYHHRNCKEGQSSKKFSLTLMMRGEMNIPAAVETALECTHTQLHLSELGAVFKWSSYVGSFFDRLNLE